jgi:YfiH family protein
MQSETTHQMVGVEYSLSVRFRALTTSREFDDDLNTPWDACGRRVRELVLSRGWRPPGVVVLAGQVHGTTISSVTADAAGVIRMPSCDGLISQREDAILVIRTADCVPVVLLDPVAGVHGAIHAGWKGTLENIVGNCVEAMKGMGAEAHRMRAWIGPSISGSVYEVSDEMISVFGERWGRLGSFCKGRLLNLPELNRLQALDAGLEAANVVDCGLCTYSLPSVYHSHRRQGRERGHEFTICGFAE